LTLDDEIVMETAIWCDLRDGVLRHPPIDFGEGKLERSVDRYLVTFETGDNWSFPLPGGPTPVGYKVCLENFNLRLEDE
jgi:hypothetical protein